MPYLTTSKKRKWSQRPLGQYFYPNYGIKRVPGKTSFRKPSGRNKRPIKKRNRRTQRRSRRTPVPSGSMQWKAQNIGTISFDNADFIAVASNSASLGKQCKYGHVGVTQAGNTAEASLLSIPHLATIADVVIQQQSTFGQSTTTAGAAFGIETKYIIKDCFQQTDIVNTSNGNTILYAWKCVYRRDIAASENYQSPLWLLGDGFFQRNQVAPKGYSNPSMVECSSNPYDSHKFCSFINIVKQTRQIIAPGEECTFRIQHSKPQIINMNHYYTEQTANQKYANSTPDYAHRKGESFYLFRIEGQPANDKTTTTNIFYTLPKIDFITKTHYNVVQLSPNIPYNINATSIGYTAPATTVQIEQEEAGAIQQDANA